MLFDLQTHIDENRLIDDFYTQWAKLRPSVRLEQAAFTGLDYEDNDPIPADYDGPVGIF